MLPSKRNDLSLEEQKIILENTAIRYLSFRPRFSAEVINHLGRKSQELNLKDPLTLINQIVTSLEKSGFINDQKLLESYIRTKLHDKTKGPYWIKAHLLHIGLGRNEIDAALRLYADRDIQLEVVSDFISKKYRDAILDLKTKAKLFRFLAGRGFSADLIAKAFDQKSSLG